MIGLRLLFRDDCNTGSLNNEIKTLEPVTSILLLTLEVVSVVL